MRNILKDDHRHFNPFIRRGHGSNPGASEPPAVQKIRKLFWGFGLAWALLLVGFPFPFAAAESGSSLGLYPDFKPRGDIRRFNGEHLYFDISFMVFDNAATADVHFFEKDGRFYSILKAETKGFVGFFTNYRKHYYKASFDIIDNGRRVRTRKFEREVINGDDAERTTHYLDYENRRHFWFKRKNNQIMEQENNPIPEGKFYDDILAAFYNFRNEVYGPLEKGAKYKIDTIPDQGIDSISVNIFTDQEQEKFRNDERRSNKDEMLLRVLIPKEVFKTETGELLFWASRDYIPLETRVLNYVLLGDLHVVFRERLMESGQHLPTPIQLKE